MGTAAQTVDFIVDHVGAAGDSQTRKMYGEYVLYCDGKTVALICDDALFVKPTKAGEAYLGKVVHGMPLRGAKPWFCIDADHWEDAQWLSQLIRLTADELPLLKPKKKKSVRRA